MLFKNLYLYMNGYPQFSKESERWVDKKVRYIDFYVACISSDVYLKWEP